MSSSAKSIFAFGIYLAIIGSMLLVSPNLLLGLFGISATTEVWVRVTGMLALLLASGYFMAARRELVDFFRWTVYARPTVIVFFTIFVLLGFVQPTLILFGIADLVGAAWTALTLRTSKAILRESPN